MIDLCLVYLVFDRWKMNPQWNLNLNYFMRLHCPFSFPLSDLSGIFLLFSFIYVDEYILFFFWAMFGSGKFEGNKIERKN